MSLICSLIGLKRELKWKLRIEVEISSCNLVWFGYVCAGARSSTNLLMTVEECSRACGLVRRQWGVCSRVGIESMTAVFQFERKLFLSPVDLSQRQSQLGCPRGAEVMWKGKHLQSGRKYWQVNRSSSGIRLRRRPARKPEKTRLLHGRFSWEKKTIDDSCHHLKMVNGWVQGGNRRG